MPRARRVRAGPWALAPGESLSTRARRGRPARHESVRSLLTVTRLTHGVAAHYEARALMSSAPGCLPLFTAMVTTARSQEDEDSQSLPQARLPLCADELPMTRSSWKVLFVRAWTNPPGRPHPVAAGSGTIDELREPAESGEPPPPPPSGTPRSRGPR